MARSRRRFPSNTFDAINVTPLIDTLFFLLIIFMLTAPLLEYSVEVAPPQMNANPINADSNAQVVIVKHDGSLMLNKTDVGRDQLQYKLAMLKQETESAGEPLPVVFLRGDRKREYGDVIDVMRIIRAAGFNNVQLITEEEPK